MISSRDIALDILIEEAEDLEYEASLIPYPVNETA